MATKAQRARSEKAYSEYAGEPVEVSFSEDEGADYTGGPITVFGSELAVLRIYKRMGGVGRAEFSKNLQRWYYISR